MIHMTINIDGDTKALADWFDRRDILLLLSLRGVTCRRYALISLVNVENDTRSFELSFPDYLRDEAALCKLTWGGK